ncbi:Ankyrin_repeat protein 3 [Hexamita inflata]|uniref:Ankyrin repeat protein 3 n=1 Tax=Hexamita inflata TaxID=28002 RepID=A0AA86QCH5_9EUKA|nr:Ankyrin repeat protein 3 [Hexamita inflata]
MIPYNKNIVQCQIKVYGIPNQVIASQIIFLSTNINPVSDEFIQDPVDQPFYVLLTFSSKKEAKEVHRLFGSQYEFDQIKYQNALYIQDVNINNYEELNYLKQNLIVLKNTSRGSLTQTYETSSERTQQLQKLQESLHRYQLKDQVKYHDLVQQILQVLFDIGQFLPTEVAYGDLLQLLEKKMLSIMEYVEALGELNDKERMKHVLQLLNTFLNAIISGSNVLLEIRLFCLGDSPIPLPVYKIRNKIMKNAASPFMIFESAPGSGKTLMISAFISQLPQVLKYKKRLYITQSTDMKVQQTAKALRNILGNKQTISTKPEKQSSICVCTPIQLIKHIYNNPKLIQDGMFILDDFQTRSVALDFIFAKLIKSNQDLLNIQPYQFIVVTNTIDNDILCYLPYQTEIAQRIENLSMFNVVEIHLDNLHDSDNLQQSTINISYQFIVEFVQSMQNGEKQIGNILCFSSGQSECNQICETLIQMFKEDENITCLDFAQFKNMNAPDTYAKIKELMENKNSLFVVPISVYGQTPESDNSILFATVPDDIKDRFVKVVVGSNMDESCSFVEDVIVVVDSGVVQEFSWDEEMKINIVQEKKVSDSVRNFRKNLAARTRVGYACIIENQELEEQQPEIQRLDLKHAILLFKEIDIEWNDNVLDRLPSSPDRINIANSLNVLQIMQALDSQNQITEKGLRLLKYQNIEPVIACVFERLLKEGDIFLLISVIAHSYITCQSNLITNIFSKTACENFTEESDLATLVKCFISIEQQKSQTRKQYCVNNGFNYSVYIQIRQQVQYVFDTIINSNKGQLFEIVENDNIIENRVESEVEVDYFNNFIVQIDQNQILTVLDLYVQYLVEIRQEIDQSNIQINNFACVQNTQTIPQQKYYQVLQNDLKNYIICGSRPGCKNIIAHSQVFFYSLSYNKKSGVYYGQFMHRLQNSYKCSYSVSVPQNAIMLPFTKMLVSQFFENNLDYNFIMKMIVRTNSDQIEFLAESLDKKSLYYTVDRQINQTTINIMNQIVKRIIQISAVCPTTLISRYPGLPDYYVEFFQTDNKSDARFIQKQANNENLAPFAYSLNQKAVQLLVHSKVEFKISYVFDLKMNHATFREYGYSHDFNYTGDHVSRSRNGNVVNQLIIIADKKIQELPQLKWMGQLDERQVPLQYVLKDKSAETQSSQAAGNQGQYLPFNIASKDLQKHPQIIQDIKELVREMNINNVDFTQNGFTGNANNIQRIIHEVNSGFPLNLSLKEIRYYNIPRVQIESIVSSYVDAQIIFGKNNSIIVHSSLYEEINNKILDLLDNNQDNLISFMSCGNDVCLPNTMSISSIVNKELKCTFYCPGCIQSQLENQVKEAEIQIKLGEGEENNGKFISFFFENQEFMQLALQILNKTGELVSHHNKDFKFCPICNKLATKCGTAGVDTLLYSCVTCNHKWCSDCGDWHKPGKTCVGLGNNKRCPGCKSVTEKIDGCNRIKCPCGTYWCWVCGTFAGATAQIVYQHLTTAHGGYW